MHCCLQLAAAGAPCPACSQPRAGQVPHKCSHGHTIAAVSVAVRGAGVATRLSLSPDNGCALCAWAGQWELAPVLGEWKRLQRRRNEVNSHLCTFPEQKEQCQVELQLKYHHAEM